MAELHSTRHSSIADLIQAGAATLAATGNESARLDAEVLLRHVLGVDRTRLFMRLREPVDADPATTFHRLVERRARGEPVAYLTGAREFFGLEFAVGSGVLVPRPETELLVEWAATWLAGKERASIVDVGTGSGAIILSLAKSLGEEHRGWLIGCDRSSDALTYAARNRASLRLISRVDLVRGDLLTWLGRPVDLILANLPYLRLDQVTSNPDLRAEPEIALISGPEGMDAIEQLLQDAPRVLAPGGAIALELDPSQAGRVAEMVGVSLPEARVSVLQDLAGLDRFVIVETA